MTVCFHSQGPQVQILVGKLRTPWLGRQKKKKIDSCWAAPNWKWLGAPVTGTRAKTVKTQRQCNYLIGYSLSISHSVMSDSL